MNKHITKQYLYNIDQHLLRTRHHSWTISDTPPAFNPPKIAFIKIHAKSYFSEPHNGNLSTRRAFPIEQPRTQSLGARHAASSLRGAADRQNLQ